MGESEGVDCIRGDGSAASKGERERDGSAANKGLGGASNVCIECIGQCTKFVCSNRTRKRVRLAHTNFAHCPLQSTQHY